MRCPGTGRKPEKIDTVTRRGKAVEVGFCPSCPAIVMLRPSGHISIHEMRERRLRHFENLTKGGF